jgi:hypothetical protein
VGSRARGPASAAAAALVLTAWLGAAAAAPQRILVLEAHVGRRTEAAARVLEPLRDALHRQGLTARPDAILDFAGTRGPRPGLLDPGITASAIAQRVDDGYLAYTSNNFEPAIRTLHEAIRLIQRNPAILAVDTGYARMIFKAYVSLVNSHARLGRVAESVAAMTELIRRYPAIPVTRAIYGPEAEKIYRGVWKQVRAMGRGQLTVTTGHPAAMIFVDNQLRGIGSANLSDLIPGTYQVLIQAPGSVDRQYQVDVRPNEESAIDIAWDVDASVYVGDQWVGLVFATEAERRREAAVAGALSRRWAAGDPIAIVGLTKVQDKPAILGTLYTHEGSVIRSALLSVDRADADSLLALARFLADGTSGAGVEVLRGAEPRASPRRSDRLGRRLIYAGSAAVAAGVVLYLLDEDAGAPPGKPVPKSYFDSGPPGVALGAVGVAAIGVGLWRVHRARARAAPVISLEPSRVTIGWAGAF